MDFGYSDHHASGSSDSSIYRIFGSVRAVPIGFFGRIHLSGDHFIGAFRHVGHAFDGHRIAPTKWATL